MGERSQRSETRRLNCRLLAAAAAGARGRLVKEKEHNRPHKRRTVCSRRSERTGCHGYSRWVPVFCVGLFTCVLVLSAQGVYVIRVLCTSYMSDI